MTIGFHVIGPVNGEWIGIDLRLRYAGGYERQVGFTEKSARSWATTREHEYATGERLAFGQYWPHADFVKGSYPHV